MTLDFNGRTQREFGYAEFNPGLRGFLTQVYLKLAGGLCLSAAVAWAILAVPAIGDVVFARLQGEIVGFSGWGTALVIAPLGLILLASLAPRDQISGNSGPLFWSVAGLMGVSLSLLAVVYAGASLMTTFLVSACAFVALSIFGHLTHRNLGPVGNFLTTALFGIVLALLANVLLGYPALQLVIDVFGVVVFAGLIAVDTQRLKKIYEETPDPEALGAASNYAALTAYLNFINLFQFLLSLAGRRSRR